MNWWQEQDLSRKWAIDSLRTVGFMLLHKLEDVHLPKKILLVMMSWKLKNWFCMASLNLYQGPKASSVVRSTNILWPAFSLCFSYWCAFAVSQKEQILSWGSGSGYNPFWTPASCCIRGISFLRVQASERNMYDNKKSFVVPYYNAGIIEDRAVIAKSLLQTDSGNPGLSWSFWEETRKYSQPVISLTIHSPLKPNQYLQID